MEIAFLLFLAFGLGCFIGIFVYRNNEARIDPYADQVDVFYARVGSDLLPHLTAKARAEVEALLNSQRK